ncbi:hypothetical protein [Chromobacterium subtsugae]|uniref:hypothetical protein n=1 Tax=Chromobacterium subtsugae TaxID=251747 RepID=UPI000640C310|nr:hypothetical protein [Chromobacterium subtsugae]
MQQNDINADVKRAVNMTLQATAGLSGPDRSDYLTAILAVSLGALRASAGDRYAYGFLRGAIAELGMPPAMTLRNSAGPSGPAIAISAPSGVVDPDTLHSASELRAALKHANELGLQRGEVLAAMRAALADISEQVGDLVVAHLEDDRERLSCLMAELCERHVVVKTPKSIH